MNFIKNILTTLFVALLMGCSQSVCLTQYVNPFIGTLHEGHCFPGATVPMGMVQVSPESTIEQYTGYGMDHVAGYQYNDPYLAGFTQTHLNGAGCPSMSDILLMPYCGRDIDPSKRDNFRSSYRKDSEVATPGYYGVCLVDNGVEVGLTATSHAAYHRYKFDDPTSATVLVDLQYGVGWDIDQISGNVVDCWQKSDDYSISGYRKPRVWASRDQYYTIKFNKKILKIKELDAPKGSDEIAPRYIVTFDMEGKNMLEVQIGLSTTSVEAAKANLGSEIASFGIFDDIHNQAAQRWNNILSRVELEGDHEKKVVFYTAMYHMYVQPNNIADVDGKFRAASGDVCESKSGKFYSTFSLWDTYRATHPLYTILSPSLVPDINASIMDHYTHMVVDPSNPREANRYLPRWALWGKETHTMVGNHAVPVLVDAWLKGLKPTGYSDDELFDAIWGTITKPHYRNHVELIDKYGYIPYDVSLSAIDDSRETVARLLEGIYDDYCASLMAEESDRVEECDFLQNRAGYYHNVFDKESGFMRGRNAKGEFKRDIDVTRVVGEWVAESDFTEGNAWHYLFHVQHDIEGLQELMGGEQAFGQKLDSMFYSHVGFPYVKDLVWNIYGTLGQYWHGNEPCHHVPYLYKYTSEGYKTDAIIRYLVDNFSLNAPDGLKGNDDCGQMSAWYIFATMGLYPVNPCGGEFVLGAPQLPVVALQLENDKQFRVVAENISDDNLFVESVSLNGEPLTSRTISYSDIMQGGELVFNMTSREDRLELQNFKINKD